MSYFNAIAGSRLAKDVKVVDSDLQREPLVGVTIALRRGAIAGTL